MRQPVSSKHRTQLFRRRMREHSEGSAGETGSGDGGVGDGAAGGEKGSTPANAPRPDPARRRHFRREYRQWLWPYRGALTLLFVLSFVTALLDLAWPLFIKLIADLLPGAAPAATKLHRLDLLGGAVVILLLCKSLVDAFRGYRYVLLNTMIVARLRVRLYHKLLGLPLSDLSEMKAGGIVSRLSGDIDSVGGLVQLAIVNPAVASLRVLLTVGIVLYLSPRLAFTSLVLMPPLAVISFLWLKRVRPVYRSIREDRSTIDARVTETFGGLRVVRSFRREPREELSHAVGLNTVVRKSLFAEWLELLLGAVWGLLIPGISVVVVWYGGHLVTAGKATVGDIVAFQVYAALLIQPVWQIVSSVSQTQKSLAAMERVFEVLEMAPDKPDAPDAVDAPHRVEEIRLDHVGFAYRPGVPVLSDLSFTVSGGTTVALVGASGAGKTTLTDLVARFQDPTSGSISLNGIDLRRLRLSTYRRLMAVVQQDVFLFDGTVRDNIAYGRRGATETQILDAARRANAHEFIDRLPERYNTLIGERGFKLSGGQRQRLSIARAILADPQILILDEATSNLDTESEQLIQASLTDLLRNRTTFVIAHRLSTITHADLIVVLEGGEPREIGGHDELMRLNGLYAVMVERQRKSLSGLAGSVAVD